MTSYEAQDKLGRLRLAYPNARSTTRQVIEQAIKLADELVHDVEVAEAARADGRIQEVERQREREQSYLETYRTRVRQLEETLAEKRRLHEEREESGEEVQVKVGRSLGGSWTIADLEEIVYRLRCGGGTDDTPVKVTDYTATAKVAAPELVPLVRPDSGKVDRTPPSFAPDLDIVEWRGPSVVEVRVAAALGVTIVLLLVANLVLGALR